jgi:CheY-like chemotaxis protein
MMQCSDGIGTFVERVREPSTTAEELEECLDSIIENSQTISLCAAFQKRIVDDMLTISKLESKMLAMTPTLIEPAEIVRASIQIIEAEVLAADITFDFIIEDSYFNIHQAEWVHCDPSRLTQVLINLFTNAVKFTKLEAKREIRVTLGATQKISTPPNWRWFPSAHCSTAEPGDACGENEVFLTFTIQDTGKGISDDEMSLLFNRFAQASPKTHVKYGGSGLGLYISRELTELMSGTMAISSSPGSGSLFFFYVKATRATPSEVQLERRGTHSSNILIHATGNVKHVSSASTSNSIRRRASNAMLSVRGHDPKAGIWAQSPRLVTRKRTGSDTNSSRTSPMPTTKITAKILLVEDNVINAAVLSKQLRRLNHKVHLSNHGGEALDYLRTTNFWAANKGQGDDLTVILLDWEMPEIDGIRCSREIRKWEREGLLTKHLHIILCSANGRDEQIRIAKDAGVVCDALSSRTSDSANLCRMTF